LTAESSPRATAARLAIGEQRQLDALDRIVREQLLGMRIALLGAHHRAARGVLEELGREPARGQGAGLGALEPAVAELAPGHERERQRVGVHRAAHGHVEDQAYPRAQRGGLQRARRGQRHARGHRGKRRGRALVESREHAARELPASAALRQGRHDLVQRDGGGSVGDPVQIVGEPRIERELNDAAQDLGRDAVERRRPRRARALAESGHRLAPVGSPLRLVRISDQGRQGFSRVRASAHLL
jgi:hypothetical protein